MLIGKSGTISARQAEHVDRRSDTGTQLMLPLQAIADVRVLDVALKAIRFDELPLCRAMDLRQKWREHGDLIANANVLVRPLVPLGLALARLAAALDIRECKRASANPGKQQRHGV